MNLTNFAVPMNSLCSCNGRWALDPSEGSMKDDTYDIDNDTLAMVLKHWIDGTQIL